MTIVGTGGIGKTRLAQAVAHERWTITQVGCAWLSSHRCRIRREALREAVAYWRRDGLVLRYSEYPALLVAKGGRHADAARLAGARDSRRQRRGLSVDPYEELARADLLQCLEAAQIRREDIER